MTEPDRVVDVFTDGACSGNPGVGGWAALLRYGGVERMLHGVEAHTTNNRMELLAAMRALEALKRPSRVHLATDSQYVQKGIGEWVPKWRANGWLTADRKPVRNKDLWERLSELTALHEVTWEWVRGHAGHPENDRVDRQARAAVDAFKQEAGEAR
ncbi:MAG TPA: ribonuclease HI [Xanthomonadales bacterium]|nr:ribonuclease HI [Xanthomonadales bacterium]